MVSSIASLALGAGLGCMSCQKRDPATPPAAASPAVHRDPFTALPAAVASASAAPNNPLAGGISNVFEAGQLYLFMHHLLGHLAEKDLLQADGARVQRDALCRTAKGELPPSMTKKGALSSMLGVSPVPACVGAFKQLLLEFYPGLLDSKKVELIELFREDASAGATRATMAVALKEAAPDDAGSRCAQIKEILASLEQDKLVQFALIVQFLGLIEEQSDKNLMTAQKLSECMADKFFTGASTPTDYVAQLGSMQKAVEFMILHQKEIFDPSLLVDEKFFTHIPQESITTGGLTGAAAAAASAEAPVSFENAVFHELVRLITEQAGARGIFREPGNADTVRSIFGQLFLDATGEPKPKQSLSEKGKTFLRKKSSKAKEPRQMDEVEMKGLLSDLDINDLVGVFKKMLQSEPEFQHLLSAVQDRLLAEFNNEGTQPTPESVRDMIQEHLPRERELLAQIIKMLVHVRKTNATWSREKPLALATCLAPNFFEVSGSTDHAKMMEEAALAPVKNRVVAFMIEHYQAIFESAE
ncbi:MAG: hypothetical protein P0S96_01230 [Simkaniaceae bacterium]|nr:hypothetical protein [Candidatus Sacchlamyda saccharinae]